MSDELSLGELEFTPEDFLEYANTPEGVRVVPVSHHLAAAKANKILAERIKKYGSHFACDESNRLTNRGRGIGPNQEGYLVCVRKLSDVTASGIILIFMIALWILYNLP